MTKKKNKYSTLSIPESLSCSKIQEELEKKHGIQMTANMIRSTYFKSLEKIVYKLSAANGFNRTQREIKEIVKNQGLQNQIGLLVIKSFEGI